MNLLDNQYDIGDRIYLLTDKEQDERFITGILLRQSGISYAVSCGINESWHYDFEITKEKVLQL